MARNAIVLGAASMRRPLSHHQPVEALQRLARWPTVGRRALPDFLIIGAQKAGTTSLFDYLDASPHVCSVSTSRSSGCSGDSRSDSSCRSRSLVACRTCSRSKGRHADVFFVLLAVKICPFGSSLLFSGEAYAAANKLIKPAWCILGLGVALQLVGSPIGFLSIAFRSRPWSTSPTYARRSPRSPAADPARTGRRVPVGSHPAPESARQAPLAHTCDCRRGCVHAVVRWSRSHGLAPWGSRSGAMLGRAVLSLTRCQLTPVCIRTWSSVMSRSRLSIIAASITVLGLPGLGSGAHAVTPAAEASAPSTPAKSSATSQAAAGPPRRCRVVPRWR